MNGRAMPPSRRLVCRVVRARSRATMPASRSSAAHAAVVRRLRVSGEVHVLEGRRPDGEPLDPGALVASSITGLALAREPTRNPRSVSSTRRRRAQAADRPRQPLGSGALDLGHLRADRGPECGRRSSATARPPASSTTRSAGSASAR